MNDRSWVVGNHRLAWGQRTLVMGIVNVTPDSFSDGGQFAKPAQAIRHASQLLEDGADIIDIGGESTRPGAEVVPVEEELKRVIPVIREIAGPGNGIVSIDTTKYEVAKAALESGAVIINDISGLQRDIRLAQLASDSEAGFILMHMRGTPQTMQTLVHYEDVVSEIRSFFEQKIELSLEYGVKKEQIVLDPGIGFSKTTEQNLVLINRLEELRLDHLPLIVGVSRKSFLGKITGKEVNDRLYSTLGAVTATILKGANIIRVHDVRETIDVVQVVDAIRSESIQYEEELPKD